jgi:DNA (cytosine-5)-methyltransferase 1
VHLQNSQAEKGNANPLPSLAVYRKKAWMLCKEWRNVLWMRRMGRAQLKFLSVFSGIEAALVAWEGLGFEAIGFSEIDPFCCAVLEYHFSDVKNYGDINTFKRWKIGQAVDVMVGGSPCQSYSLAGNRRGSADERGRLMFTYGNLVGHLRPRWIVWENVTGVLSSGKGRDFAEFLCMLDGYGYGLAWRILDAQYFGVPQRRRRVFVVGYLGDVRRPASVFIDGKGGGRDTSPLGTEGEPSPRTGRGTGAAVYNVHQHDSRYTKAEGLIDTVTGLWGTGGNNTPLCLMDQGGDIMQVEHGKTGTLRASEHQHNPIVFNRATISTYKPDSRMATLLGDHHDNGLVNLVPGAVDGLLRRITPVEAERLQGFPDGWTRVPYKNRTAERCPDGPRYKAIGNSMAVPVMRWLGRRIKLVEEIFREAR